MAEELGNLKITAETDAETKALIKLMQGKGITNIKTTMGGAPGKERFMVQGSGTAGQIQGMVPHVPTTSKYMTQIPQSAAGQATGLFDRLKGTFTSKNMKDINKSLFMLQMSSLGVAFSFASIINSVMGLFAGLSDLGTMISTGAIGTAFAGIATGGANTTDIAGTMGVTTEMQTAAWAGFTAIVSQFKSVFDALAVKVLTPEMVAAILSVIDALAITLADPAVAKAIQEIVKAVLEIALALIPLIPVIADLVTWLGETGLLKVLLLIIVAAEILLPTLAYIQFAFTSLMTLGELLYGIMVITGISFGWLLVAIGAVAFVIVFLVNVFTNLANGMSLMDAVTNAFGQTIATFINLLIGLINPILGFLGQKKIDTWSTSTNAESAQMTTAKTTVNNITFANAVDLSNRKTATKTALQVSNATMG